MMKNAFDETLMDKLQPQQQLAVSLYLKSMNQSQAARDAGYASTAIFKHDDVQAAMNEQLQIRAVRLRVGADWVLMELVKVYHRCMQIEPIVKKDGEHTGEFKFDATNAIKALNTIGKHVDISAFNINDNNTDTMDEILERLRRGRDRLQQKNINTEKISFLEPPH